MKTKTKIMLSVGAVCLVAVVAVVAIVAVFAAQTQTVNSTIQVTYKATNVVGTATGNTIFNNVKKPMSGTATFDYNSTGAATLSPETITLTDATDEQYVVFEYKFTNGGDNAYNAVLKFTGTATNVTVYTTEEQDGAEVSSEYLTNIATTISDPAGAETTLLTLNVTANNADGAYAYILVKLTNPAQNAEFNGTFAWTLANAAA